MKYRVDVITKDGTLVKGYSYKKPRSCWNEMTSIAKRVSVNTRIMCWNYAAGMYTSSRTGYHYYG